jgi:hypothetical protein
MTISDIADEVIAHIGLDRDREDVKVATVMEQHAVAVAAGQHEAFKGLTNNETRTAKRLTS